MQRSPLAQLLQPLNASPSHCPKYFTTQPSELGTLTITVVSVTVTVSFVDGGLPPFKVTYVVDVEVDGGGTVTVTTVTVFVTVTTTCY